MANAIDDLRNALLNRYKQPASGGATGKVGPAQEQARAAQEKMYSLDATGGLAKDGAAPMLGGDVAPSGGAISSVRTPSSLMTGLKDALAGRSGAGSSVPKTGMTPPTWSGTPAPMGPSDIPVGLPNDSAKIPPRWKRFETGQRMQDAYRNDWQPNPILLRILEGGR